MTITLQYKTEDGKSFDSLEAAQMHEALAADGSIYLEEWKEKKLFEALLASFDVKLRVIPRDDFSSDSADELAP